MSQFTFSIALCTYNGGSYLPAQLDSLLAQTRLPEEVVIADDASEDDTMSQLEAFATKARSRGIHVDLLRRTNNVGFVENFSGALTRTTQDIVCLCDQDDRWRPEKLALFEEAFARQPALTLLFSDATLVDGTGMSLGHTLFQAIGLMPDERELVQRGEAFRVLLRRGMVTGATAAFRRDLVRLALPVPEGWIHDEWLAVVAAATGRVDVVPRPLIDYRQHGGNLIGARRRNIADKWRDMTCPRDKQLRAEVKRSEQLAARLGALGNKVPGVYRLQVERRGCHFMQRVALGSQPRVDRLRAIMSEARSGNYERFGTGIRSMLRDFLRRG